MTQRLNQFRVLFDPICVQPLLELVDDNQQFFPFRKQLIAPQGEHRFLEPHGAGQTGTLVSKRSEQTDLGLVGGRFDVNCQNVVRQSGQ